jgi:pimeloyl-ACP methyl ester carboxylesterase
MYRNRNALVQANITLAWMDWPSESNFGISGVNHPDFLKDIATVVKHLRIQGPKTPIILVGANGMSRTALAYALDRKETIDGMLVLSPYWTFDRHQKVESLKSLKTLVLQDSSGQCMITSTIEVVDIAARAAFTYLPVNSKGSGRINDCSPRSANWLSSGDSEFTSTVSKWLDSQPLPAHLGPETIERSISERVLQIPAKSGTLETTIFTPKGKGPFPLVVFNHGDADTTTSWVKFKSRFVETNVSAPFLRAGFAVAIPARPGVGRSDGYYSFSHYAINDGDPTYKARQHSVAVIAALEGLKSQSNLDLNRILLAGQSAGGDTVMYMSTLQLEGVKADLLLVPPIAGDGHFIHNRSDLWLASMNKFVKEVGVLP